MDFAVVYGYTFTLAFSAFLVAGLISNDDIFVAIGVATAPIFFTSTFVFQKITKNTYTIGDYEFMGH